MRRLLKVVPQAALAQGLSALVAPLPAVAEEGVVERVGNVIVHAGRRGQAKACVSMRPIAPRRLLRADQGVSGELEGMFPTGAAVCWRQAGQSAGVRSRVPSGRSRWTLAVLVKDESMAGSDSAA
jgi:hypothetical protein